MTEDDDRAADDLQPPAANDNGNAKARRRIDAAVLQIARLIGRQMGAGGVRAAECRERRSPAGGDRGVITETIR